MPGSGWRREICARSASGRLARFNEGSSVIGSLSRPACRAATVSSSGEDTVHARGARCGGSSRPPGRRRRGGRCRARDAYLAPPVLERVREFHTTTTVRMRVIATEVVEDLRPRRFWGEATRHHMLGARGGDASLTSAAHQSDGSRSCHAARACATVARARCTAAVSAPPSRAIWCASARSASSRRSALRRLGCVRR
jgi:hypothetical protein